MWAASNWQYLLLTYMSRMELYDSGKFPREQSISSFAKWRVRRIRANEARSSVN